MEDALKRNFKKGDCIYVVDYWGFCDGTRAFCTRAYIESVNNENETFIADMYGDTYQRYSFKDYGRLIFDTESEAAEAAIKLPKPNQTVYQVIGKRVYEKLVEGIRGRSIDMTYDLVVCFYRGKDVSIKEIGHSLFYSREEAIKKRNKK